MDDKQVQRIYEDVINEQAQRIQMLEKENSGLHAYAKVVAAHGRAARAKNKEKGFKPKTHSFVKVLKTVNQKARRSSMFTASEKQLLFDIMPFIGFDSRVLNEDKTPMSIKEIADLCGWGKSHTIVTINGLVEKGVLERVKDKTVVHIKVSQDYMKCG